MFGLAMSGCSNASPSPAANNVAENVQQASDEKAIPSNYPGAPEAIAIGIGKHEGQFFRTIVQNDAVTYMSLVNRDARNGTALAWDVTVLRDISQPLSVKMYVGLWHYDCRKRTSVWVHSMSINDQWKVVDSSTPYFQDVANVEGSGGDEQTKFACGEKNRAKPVKDLLNDANRFFAIDE